MISLIIINIMWIKTSIITLMNLTSTMMTIVTMQKGRVEAEAGALNVIIVEARALNIIIADMRGAGAQTVDPDHAHTHPQDIIMNITINMTNIIMKDQLKNLTSPVHSLMNIMKERKLCLRLSTTSFQTSNNSNSLITLMRKICL